MNLKRATPPIQMVRIWMAIVAVVLALLGFSRLGGHEESPAVEEQTSSATEEPSRDETEKAGAQTTEGDTLGSGSGRPTSGTSAGKRASSKDSRSGGSLPAGTTSQSPEKKPPQAGPPVFYVDQGDDAWGFYGAPSDRRLSQAAFDILRVDWAPVSYVNEHRPGGYSTSITVSGAARDDGSYYSYGVFRSDVPGEDCQLFHFLTPGITAFANAWCGSNYDGTRSRRFVGHVQGSPVTSTPTTDGGTLLSATFDNRAIPPLLQAAGRSFYRLGAVTCAQKGFDCTADTLDNANSTLTYRV